MDPFEKIWLAALAFLLLSGQYIQKINAVRPAAIVTNQQQSWVSAEDTSTTQLRLRSQELDRILQSTADELEPGATLDFLRALRLCAPCKHFERFGGSNDGGYVTCTDGLDEGLVGALSYGIEGRDGWGMAVASRCKIPLDEYDCTNPLKPQACAGCTVRFHSECITHAKSEPKEQYKTLSKQLQESGYGNIQDRSLLLKIDVESAEWEVFAEEPVESMKKFREIIVEYHNISLVNKHNLYAQAVGKIEDAGFADAHLHGNNYGGELQEFGKYRIPNVLEVTYMQKPAHGCVTHMTYRSPNVDQPNNPHSPELGDAVLPTSL